LQRCICSQLFKSNMLKRLTEFSRSRRWTRLPPAWIMRLQCSMTSYFRKCDRLRTQSSVE
jgi:hypothetical protein